MATKAETKGTGSVAVRSGRRARWTEVDGLAAVERLRASGLTVATFAARHDESVKRLRYWLRVAAGRELGGSGAGPAEVRFVEATAALAGSAQRTSEDLATTPALAVAGLTVPLTLRVGSELSVELGVGATPGDLRTLLGSAMEVLRCG